MAEVSYPVAAFAGLLSFISPCVLPLVPPYLSYLAGQTVDTLTKETGGDVNRRALIAALGFVLGFSTVFVLLGASASAMGLQFRALNAPIVVFGLTIEQPLSMLAGLTIIVMGLHFIGVFRIAFLYREARLDVRKPAGAFGAYVMGLAFAFGWTPCIGPILAAILSLAGSEESVGRGAALLAVYSAGLGVPFLLAAFAMRPFVGVLKRMRSRMHLIEKLMGAFLVLTGIAFLTGTINTFGLWLLETFPALQQFG
jgi:cytochrome c-type biogenesis protein